MCCAGSALCCASTMICRCLCAPFSWCGVHSKNFAKIGYTFMQGLMMIIATILMFCSKKMVDWMPDKMVICDGKEPVSKETCLANGFIGRMSFILCCFHLMVFFICLGRN